MYSLISGVGIFFLGAGVTVYHGVAGLFNPAPLENLTMVSFNKQIFVFSLIFLLKIML